MGTRLSRLIGALAVLLALARLERLLSGSISGPPWPETLIVVSVIAGLLSWLLGMTRVSRPTMVAIHVVGVVIAMFRIAAPTELISGFIPGSGAISEMGRQLADAGQLIRFGASPVPATAGLTAVLAVLFWILGALAATGRPAIGSLPALVVYLQFATLDRRPPGAAWVIAFAIIGSAALLSLLPRGTRQTGRVRSTDGRLLPRRSSSVVASTLVGAAALSLSATVAMAATVPETGVLSWRTPSGIGAGLYGGGSGDLFVSLHQSVVNLSDDPMFYARLNDSAPTDVPIYWKLTTLDVFDGENWGQSSQSFARGGVSRWERPDWSFVGPTETVRASIRIAGLKSQYLPTIYSPTALTSDENLISQTFRVREDGSIGLDLRTVSGWDYQIQAAVPRPDVAELSTSDGRLTPLFSAAARAGRFSPVVSPGSAPPRPDSLETFTDLPPIDSRVRNLARNLTEGAESDFERASILEAFFRDPAYFAYSTNVSTGHSALDLADWLTAPDSRNYRTGYCEQFATAMAVMGRTLGIPSRVVLGFTPGATVTQTDGSPLIVVRENNAHAWVEMWMDGQGWVQFDPTPRSDGANPSFVSSELGFDPRDYLPAPEDAALNGPGSASAIVQGPREDSLLPGGSTGETTSGSRPLRLPSWPLWIIGVMAAIGAVPFTKRLRRRSRIRRMTEGDIAAAWAEIVDRLADLGSPADRSHTPLETASLESAELVPLAHLYSAAAYGDKAIGPCLEEFERAEGALRRRYEPGRWRLSWMNVRSFRRR